VLTDGGGGPLGAVIAGANVPDCKLLEATIEAIVVERPDPGEVEQHLCLDAGFDNPSGRKAVEAGGYVGHIRPSGNGARGKRRPGRRKPRRWVVERTLGWLSKCRGILVRYDKKDVNYLGLIQLACGTPVVSSRAGSLPEVIGRAGLFFDPTDVRAIADALRRVLADPSAAVPAVARGPFPPEIPRCQEGAEVLETL